MSACKLQGEGCSCGSKLFSCRSWSLLPKPCQPLRRKCTIPKATGSLTTTLTRNYEVLCPHLQPTLLGCESAVEKSSTSASSIAVTPAISTNGAVALLLRTTQAAAMQQLSAEISRLVTELDTELSSFLDSASTSTFQQPDERKQQLQQPQCQSQPVSNSQQPARSGRPSATSVAMHQPYGGGGNGDGRAAASMFDPLALNFTSPVAATAILPLLSLSRQATQTREVTCGTVADAGSRAERRRQNWRRGSAAGTVRSAPDHEIKFKTSGTGSISILMGSFSKDHILSVEEEQLLAAAAQDFMQLDELSHVLTTVLRRPPSMAEMAKSLHCDEAALRLRMDCGNRARTLLAQKNYRLVVSIAKRLVRPTSAAAVSGSVSGTTSGGAGGGFVTIGDGGVSLDDAITVGMEALMHAIRKFKPEAGYRLSTYATWWIRLRVSRLVQAQAGVISMSVYQRTNLDRYRAARAQLCSQMPPGVFPTPQQLAELTGMSVSQVAQMETVYRAFASGTRSFEAPVSDGDGEKGLRVEDLVAQETDAELSEGSASSLFLDSEDFAASASLFSTVEDLLASLDRGESEILRRQYGLGGLAKGPGEDGKEEEEEGETAKAASGKVSGASRLKLGRKRRMTAARALEKLRLSAGADSRLEEWLQVGTAKTNYATRSSGGYAKKSRG